jgi:hypothetical protein
MQILIQVLCTRGPSLRESIANDLRTTPQDLRVIREKQAGRAPGWMKLESSVLVRGVMNVEWDPSSSVLIARVITRGNAVSPIVGDFVNYVLGRHRRRVKTIVTSMR